MSKFTESLTETHGQIIRNKLGHLYSLQPTLDLLYKYPRGVAQAFTDYASLFDRFFNMSPREQIVVNKVTSLITDNPHESATEFRSRVRGYEKLILTTVWNTVDPGTTSYKEGLDNLATMMTNAWDMKVDGLSPRDGDPRSDRVIWGFVLGATNPWINIHFGIAHLVERVLTSELKGTPLGDFASRKDWSFPVPTAIVGLDGVNRVGAGNRLLTIWHLPRPNGLGWISNKRIIATAQVLSTVNQIQL